MLKRGFLTGLVSLLVLVPAVLRAQGLTIDHKEVGCMVAGQFPKLGACFAPASSLAHARVYFRVAGGTHWYFVEMKSEAPCHAGILPKPRKTTTKIEYYVEAVDKAFAESRTAEYDPDVVGSAQECKKQLPVAPVLSKASVVVGAVGGAPVVPAGFAAAGVVGAAGVGAGVVAAGVVGAGAAAAGVAAATGGSTTTTVTAPTLGPPGQPTPSPPPTTAPATTTTTTTTTTTPPPPFVPSIIVIPDPPNGTEPFTVSFDMCASTGTQLRYLVDFNGTGNRQRGPCRASQTYTYLPSFSLFAPPTTQPCFPPQVPCPVRTIHAQACVGESGRSPECRNVTIEVTQASSGGGPPLFSEPVRFRRLAWTSQLDVPGARGQVVVNGSAASYSGNGRSAAAVMGRTGENRIEAQLVQASGRPGTWRFDLGSTPSLEIGSLRVVAGEVALLTADAIVFRMSGKPGERVVFAFRTVR